MRAAIYHGPGDIRAGQVAGAPLEPGDVRLEILAAGVCGTDVRIYKGEHRAAQPGRVPGHEIVGRIVEASGPLPVGLAADDVVFVAPNIGCGYCRWCGRGQENLCPQTEAIGITLDGAFAERLVVPARAARRGNLIRLAGAAELPWVDSPATGPSGREVAGVDSSGTDPSGGDLSGADRSVADGARAGQAVADAGWAQAVQLEGGSDGPGVLGRVADAGWAQAVLLEPLACVVRGQAKVAIAPGDSVLVMGGGPVGLLHIALARARGAGVIICSEPSPARRQAACRAGASHTIDPTDQSLEDLVAALTGGIGIDVVITAAPVHALQAQALQLAAPQGRVLYFGGLPKSRPSVELDTNLVHYKELLIAGTTASTIEDCRQAAALVVGGLLDIGWMISHRFDLDQMGQAMAAAQDPTALKVVVIPGAKPASPVT